MACPLTVAIVVTVFAYSPRVIENDADPWRGACGRVFAGSVAVSRDLFSQPGFTCGDVITVNGRQYIVNDTMGKEHRRSVDVWHKSTRDAYKYGRRGGFACSRKAWRSPSLGYSQRTWLPGLTLR